MQKAIDETERRRTLQKQFNDEHGIVPKTIKKDIRKAIETLEYVTDEEIETATFDEIGLIIENLTQEMFMAAENLEFEKAAELRDRINQLRLKQNS